MLNNFKNNTVTLLIILISLTSYGKQTTINIVSTTTPIASLAKAIGGEYISLNVLQRTQGCPHHYQITPDDFASINHADLILAIDPNFESYLTIITKRFSDKNIILLSKQDNLLIRSSNKYKKNWHIWLDLRNAETLLQHFAELFTTIAPDYKQYFTENLDQALDKIHNLRAIQNTIYENIPLSFIWATDLIYLMQPSLKTPEAIAPRDNQYDFIKFAQEEITPNICLISTEKSYRKEIQKILPKHLKIAIIDGDNWQWNLDNESELGEIYFNKFTEIMQVLKKQCS